MRQEDHLSDSLTIILPARNEAGSLSALLPQLRDRFPGAELLVVDDGSTDATREVCDAQHVRVLRHLQSLGNGAAIKTGARAATGNVLLFMDGDGQHNPEDVDALLQKLALGYDMVVGARQRGSQATLGRSIANSFYNWLASWMTGKRIEDLTSGFRVADAAKFRQFLHLLPNGFSYPTSITMSFFRAGYQVAYVPVRALSRQGKSHIRLFHDGVRFLLIIFKIGALYSPLKLFLPMSLGLFGVGLGYYAFTYVTGGRFTNMSGLLFSTSVLVFLIGLVSEQITMLLYKDPGK